MNLITVRKLSFTYPDGSPALKEINLILEKDRHLAVIGPNGAGKSTLLLHLNGVLKGAGFIEVLGRPVKKPHLDFIRQKVGLVFQNPDHQLFMPTVYDDLAFGLLNAGMERQTAEKRVKDILESLNLQNLQDKKPQHLSLGEKKKISLATVLVLNPEILVLDEPSTSLDPGSRRQFIRIIKTLSATKLIATHDLDLAWELCPEIILLDRGRIAARGAREDILTDEPLLLQHNLEVPHEAGLYLQNR
jgi:cobalt/nickel transport system ATP-binding protein